MAIRTALGGNYHPKSIENALNRLDRNLAQLEKTSKPKKRKPTTVKKTTGPRGGMTYNDIFKWTKTGATAVDRMMELFVEDLTTTLKGKGRTWAVETKAMMREVSPVLTGNLRDSVKILSAANTDSSTIGERLEIVDKNHTISYIVGISEKAILPPPHRKHIIVGPNEGKMKTMPDFNYADAADAVILETKSSGYQGYDFLEKWQEIAKKNMERIF